MSTIPIETADASAFTRQIDSPFGPIMLRVLRDPRAAALEAKPNSADSFTLARLVTCDYDSSARAKADTPININGVAYRGSADVRMYVSFGTAPRVSVNVSDMRKKGAPYGKDFITPGAQAKLEAWISSLWARLAADPVEMAAAELHEAIRGLQRAMNHRDDAQSKLNHALNEFDKAEIACARAEQALTKAKMLADTDWDGHIAAGERATGTQ